MQAFAVTDIFCTFDCYKPIAMEVKKIQEELARLTALVDGWQALQDIPAIERDLALDKLKSLYETVRFAEPQTETSEPASEEPEEPEASAEISIDLDDVMIEPLAVTATVDLGGKTTQESPVAPQHPQTAAQPEAKPETKIEPEPMPKSEPASVEAPASESHAESQPAAEPASEPHVEPEPVPGSEPAAEAVEAESAQKASELQSKPESEPVVEPQSHDESPLLGSLFDTEGLVVRHREKRRVLMSLYETEPRKESGATESRKESVATELRKETVAKEPRTKVAVNEPRPEPQQKECEAEVVEQPAVEQSAVEQSAVEEIPVVEQLDERIVEVIPMEEPEESEPETMPQQPAEPVASEPAEPLPTDDGKPRIGRQAVRTTVLGEVIGSEVHTLADTIPAVEDVASEIVRREKITDLKQAIGINDKFLLIRDLFDGDSQRYEEAIDRLNAFDDLDDCLVFISEHYDWNAASDGVKLLMELLDRKLS